MLVLISENLHRLLRDGARPSKLAAYPDLLGLDAVAAATEQDQRDPVFTLEALLLDAVARLGDGAEGRAVQVLFGLHPDTRGRPLKDRRRLAAEEFDVMPSTFRRYYEDELVEDLAVEVWRVECASPISISYEARVRRCLP